jgi:hypothetical protein
MQLMRAPPLVTAGGMILVTCTSVPPITNVLIASMLNINLAATTGVMGGPIL